MAERSNQFRRRITALRDRVNDRFHSILNGHQEDTLIQGINMFRSEGGPIRPRGTRRDRQVTFRVSLLNNAHLTRLTAQRDATASKRLAFPLSLSSEAFKQALRDNIPGCPENFYLCRVNGTRHIMRLNESSPAELHTSNILNRSALYLQPKDAAQHTSPARAPASPPSGSLPPPQQRATPPSLPAPSGSLPPPQQRPMPPSLPAPSGSLPPPQQRPTPPSQPAPSGSLPPPQQRPTPPSQPAPSGSLPPPQQRPTPPSLPATSGSLPPPQQRATPPSQPAPSGLLFSETSDVGDSLRALREEIFLDAPSANQINVIRGEEFDCALRAFRRAAFDPKSKIDIIFVDDEGKSEGAVDAGGPTREFSRLLIAGIEKSSIFEGPVGSKSLALDAVALHQKTYREAGRMVAVCLVQVGVSPHFFSPRLFNQIADLPTGPACIKEVWDQTLREKLEKIEKADTLEEIREAVISASDELAPMGVHMYVTAIEQKKDLLQAVVDFYCHGRIQAALQQFREGLLTLGLLEEVVVNPHGFRALFLEDTTPLTARLVRDLFVPVLSPPGSNRRQGENRALAYWQDWLLEVEGGGASVGLQDVLIFATGLKKIPAMGFFPQPELHFLDSTQDGTSRLPKANTCSMSIKIPVCVRFQDFKENMDFGIGGADQFGEP